MRSEAVRKASGAALCALVVALCLTSCGYQWVRHTGSLGPVHRIAIETLSNNSYQPGVELMMTRALLQAFLQSGDVRLVRNPKDADLVLSGSVASVDVRGRSFSSVVLALEYEVTVQLQLQARLADGTKVPIDPTALRDSELYLASADVEAGRKNREEALRTIANTLAQRVHDALAEELAR